jgi:cobalamin-dependent methionine synthase I
MINADLRDRSVELDVLMGRATTTKKKTSELNAEFSDIADTKNYFPDAMEAMENGVEKLQEAGKFYWLYYRSEDTPQENLRERIMRRRAREAYELFQKAGNEVAAAG